MNIKLYRQMKGLSQKDLADALGISISTLSRYESGQIKPSSEKLREISKLLGISVDSLIGNVDIEIRDSSNEDNTFFVEIDQYQSNKEFTSIQRLSYYKNMCDLCKKPAPFADQDGNPYLELHHIKWLSQGGKAVPENTVLLCPNCHRKIHILNDPVDIMTLEEAAKKHTT